MKIDEIDVKDVHFIEDKIKVTMCRINDLRKWKCAIRLYGLKDRMIQALRVQLDFLARVNRVKYKDVVNDMGD